MEPQVNAEDAQDAEMQRHDDLVRRSLELIMMSPDEQAPRIYNVNMQLRQERPELFADEERLHAEHLERLEQRRLKKERLIQILQRPSPLDPNPTEEQLAHFQVLEQKRLQLIQQLQNDFLFERTLRNLPPYLLRALENPQLREEPQQA